MEHFFSLGLKKLCKGPDFVHSWPQVDTQMLPYHGKPVSSLSSPHCSQCITYCCDHSSHDHRVGQNYLKFFSSDYPLLPFRIDAAISATLLEGDLQVTNTSATFGHQLEKSCII
jgi:hypothetical protein